LQQAEWILIKQDEQSVRKSQHDACNIFHWLAKNNKLEECSVLAERICAIYYYTDEYTIIQSVGSVASRMEK
jgi:hypothetical protein